MRPRHRIAIVLDHPVQHFAPAFRDLESSDAVDATVLYRITGEGGLPDPGFGRVVEWDIDLLSGYRWWAPSRRAGLPAALMATVRQLERVAPQLLLVFGWATPTARLAIGWALARSRPLLLYGDSTWQHDHRGLQGLLRTAALRLLFHGATGAFSTGTFNREFYIRHGMHPGKILTGVYPVDVDLYRAPGRDAPRPGKDRTVIGFAGKLVPRKGVHELLAALALLPPGTWEARIAGDGHQRSELETLARHLGIDAAVAFLGFVNQSAMPAFLAQCDVVVVPSTWDMRVLIVLEAMAAGAAVVVSSNTAVWGAGDVIDDGRTGLVFRSGDPGDLARCLGCLIADQSRVRTLASQGQAHVDDYGPGAFRSRLEDAVATCLG